MDDEIDKLARSVVSGSDSSSKKTKKATATRASKSTTAKRTAKKAESLELDDKAQDKLSQKIAKHVEKRKLTKKAKSTLKERWSLENRGAAANDMMAGLRSAAKEKFGSEKVFGSREELECLAVGIPIPSLAFEYVIANNIFPLQSMLMLAGSWGSCKSTLAYEFFRWFTLQDGVPVHIDTEDKFDGDWACNVMQSKSEHMPIISSRAGSTEEMQQMLTYYLKEMAARLKGTKENPGPGGTVPCIFTVDSLAGSTSEEIQDKVSKEGHANRTHPINALKNTIYLPAAKALMREHPFCLVIVNHLKTKTDDMGREHEYTLGGQSFNFHESFELRNSVWRQKYKNSQFYGVGIKIRCAKNSFGAPHRAIKTRLLWWAEDDPETGEVYDRVVWDWDWAIVNLLHEADGIERRRLKERGLDIKVKSPAADIECLASMPALGMGKDEYLPWTEVGSMIQQNSHVADEIRRALNIKKRRILDRPYAEILKEFEGSVK